MGFESGNVSFRLFYLTQQYTSAIVEEFAKRVAPPIEKLDRDPISGWVGSRHLFDREISDEKSIAGPFLHVQLLKAEKKIPASLLRAYQKLEEEVEMKARGVEVLSRKAKAEAKARVIAMLQPKMPPTLLSIPTVLDFRNDLLIAGALSDKQIDAFVLYAKETIDSLPVLLTAETAAMRRKQVNYKDLNPVVFTPDEAVDPSVEGTLGMDFMTWLWFAWEKDGGVYHLPDGREFGVMLEGPVTFFREGQGAHEVALRKGAPLNSREAGTALLCGKKLKRAKITLAHAGASYTANMDSDFAFRGLKLPKGEQVEDSGKIEERMMFIEFFWSAWLHLFDTFLDLRTDPRKWQKTLANMRDWIGTLAK